MSRVRRRFLFLGMATAQVTTVASALADIPADYKGTPYMGMPSVIPGRVELANLDVGGYGVSFAADHNRMNSAGYQPLSGNDYRPTETNLPNICKTNVNPPPDRWVDGGAYPSPTDMHWYYLGYAHAHDWLRVTVDVKQAGTYSVSSNWASAGAQLGLSIWFNDGHSPVDPTHPHDGVNKTGIVTLKGTGNYHVWNSFPNFATVRLNAGLQVMTFHLEQFDHLQYGFLQFDLVGGSDAGGVPPDVGDAGGADGTGALGQGDAGAGGTGSGAASSSGVVMGSASGMPAGSTSGVVAGSSGSNGGRSGAGGSSTGTPAAPHGRSPTSAAGCACSTIRGQDARWYNGPGAFLLGCFVLLRRRTRHSCDAFVHSGLTARWLSGVLTAMVGFTVLSACSSGDSARAGGLTQTTGATTGSVVAASGSGSGSATGSGAGGSGTIAMGTSGNATSGADGGTSGSTPGGAGTDDGGAGEGGLGGSDASSGIGDAGHGMPSAGCGTPANQALMTYVQYLETVTLPAGTNPLWKNRDYYVWLPAGYDANRAYTTVFLGPGCGGKGNVVVPVQTASKTNAIIIGLDPDPPAEGRPCFNTESPTTPEIAYFDETLKQVEAKFCVNTSRVFIAGFSSGSWLADTLGCVRAGVIRGQGNAAGELQGGLTCSGQPIAAIMVHDMGDGNNSYQQHFNGGREAIRVRNGCSMATMPYDPGVAPGGKDLMGKPIQCVQYQGCKPGYPLVWCPTTGYGHNDQVGSGLSSIGWWNFWEMLP